MLALFAAAQTFDLECSFQNMDWSYLGQIETCVIRGLTVVSADETVTSINGEVIVHNNTYGFWVENQQVAFLPRALEKFLPNLKGIYIYNSQLKSIEQSDLKPFPNLAVLNLRHTNIVALPDNLFTFNENMEAITISQSANLKILSSNVIPYGEKLNSVNFQSNGCFQYYTVANSESEISNLRSRIDDSCTSPASLKTKLFGEDFNELEQKIANLENKLNSIQSAFNSCDGNLNAATKNMLISSKELGSCSKSIDASSRTDETLPVDLKCSVLDGTPVDFTVPFANMKIGTFYSNINPLNSLTIHNQQTLFLPTNIAEKIPALTTLNVTYSGLAEINKNVLKNLDKLSTLILEGNKLQEIPPDSFEYLINLMKLDLSKNRIEQLESGVFNNLDKLKDKQELADNN